MNDQKRMLTFDRFMHHLMPPLLLVFTFVAALVVQDAEVLFFAFYLVIWWLLIRTAMFFRKRDHTVLMYTTLGVFVLWGLISIPLKILEHGFTILWTALIVTLVVITQKRTRKNRITESR